MSYKMVRDISGVISFYIACADVLLMKAEAKNALGQDPSEEMNLIRKRAYGDNFDKHIFVNRSKRIE